MTYFDSLFRKFLLQLMPKLSVTDVKVIDFNYSEDQLSVRFQVESECLPDVEMYLIKAFEGYGLILEKSEESEVIALSVLFIDELMREVLFTVLPRELHYLDTQDELTEVTYYITAEGDKILEAKAENPYEGCTKWFKYFYKW